MRRRRTNAQCRIFLALRRGKIHKTLLLRPVKTHTKISRCALLATAFILVLAAAAPAHAEENIGKLTGSLPVPAGLSKGDVKDAIVMSLSSREWGIKAKTDERVVGYLKHRSNEATVTLIYDATKIDIYCTGWAIDKKTGERKKPEIPEGWLKYIKGDIVKAFNRTVTSK